MVLDIVQEMGMVIVTVSTTVVFSAAEVGKVGIWLSGKNSSAARNICDDFFSVQRLMLILYISYLKSASMFWWE